MVGNNSRIDDNSEKKNSRIDYNSERKNSRIDYNSERNNIDCHYIHQPTHVDVNISSSRERVEEDPSEHLNTSSLYGCEDEESSDQIMESENNSI